MSDSKLDYPSTSQQLAPREPRAFYSENAKLDLPATGVEFARLEGVPLSTSMSARPYRFQDGKQANATAGGVATIVLGQPATGYYWLVERLAVKGAGTATVYVGEVEDYTVMDFTPTASQDVADESSPIYVASNIPLIVVFTGAGAGTLCTVAYQVHAIPMG